MNGWIDGHLDLAALALDGRDLTAPCPDRERGCVSLPDLREGGVEIAFATIYTDPTAPDQPWGYDGLDDPAGAERAGRRQLEYYEELERAGHVSIVRARRDLDAPGEALKLVLLMEGADPIHSPERAHEWFERGLRLVGLTWSRGTRYAGGNASPGPLTPAGRELILALDELGAAHDLSHLADEAADELLLLARGPVVATHSNARVLLAGEKQRHLRDEQIRAIGERGGIVGLNLCGRFLADNRRATLADALDHVEHAAGIMGHRHGVALGSDADGGFPPTTMPEEVDHPTRFERLAEGLRERGWSENDVAGFRNGNWLRFLRECLPE